MYVFLTPPPLPGVPLARFGSMWALLYKFVQVYLFFLLFYLAFHPHISLWWLLCFSNKPSILIEVHVDFFVGSDYQDRWPCQLSLQTNKQTDKHQVIIAQWSAWRLASRAVLGSYPGNRESIFRRILILFSYMMWIYGIVGIPMDISSDAHTLNRAGPQGYILVHGTLHINCAWLLCISTSFRVLRAPESWSKYIFVHVQRWLKYRP